jgi:hypothetical protein
MAGKLIACTIAAASVVGPASRVFKAAVPQVACVLFYTSPLLRESDSSKSMNFARTLRSRLGTAT